jgi:glucose/arabinose dehydrogenase
VSRSGIALICCVTLAACDKTPTPAPPVVTPPAGSQVITGHEHLGWDQPAADAVELAAIHYAIYVDGARAELAGASCDSVIASAGFACTAPLPALSLGAHVLQLSSFTSDGSVLESAPSAALNVTVVASAATTDAAARTAWPSGQTIETQDGVKLRLELLADGLDRPADLALAPDGRVFVAERGGHIRIVTNAGVAPATAWSLADDSPAAGQVVALALDPQFAQNHFVFAIYTSPTRSGEPAFSLARFRESAGLLAERVIVQDEVSASRGDAAASLRFGPDGKLYAAFDDGGDPGVAGDLASRNGKLLRINADGSTPRDQAGGAPTYSYAYHSPGGLAWDPGAGSWWIADRDTAASARLSAVIPDPAARQGETRGAIRASFALPAASRPSAIAVYGVQRSSAASALSGSLLIASDSGRHLLRLRIDPQGPARIQSSERLLQDVVGGVRAVAVGGDGAIYFATARAVGRLVPE